ncbi:MAG: hypothetical protein HOM14_05485 [Gammaproteobacteria bacterium]|jgi:hypothetical protein|nr:hypothetical protein [Gammaproteobacteria bacterium]MBT3723895.1 hypothetical protein [Gammaproteobacteria bacterium]MBT4077391.1 hypothetical protein [Gammaproteobacteria bacterium]MBT4194262.1 hypothetical protein [Gammaproteobacteria bacterium]MBT4451632.1 hypothetical protein [Gammaproteobacteria bacterium]
MNKSISSQPDATRFRSIAVIILILICIVLFLGFTEHLTGKTDQVAKDRVISGIKHSLAMMLYDYTIQGRLEELKGFDKGNPFVPLAIYRTLPENYHGALSVFPEVPDAGWYFDKQSKRLVFVSLDGDHSSFEMIFSKGREDEVGQLLFQEFLKPVLLAE